jgi:hypothetical protein
VLGSFLFSITEEAILGVVWNRWKWGQKDEGNAEEKWGSQNSQLTHSCHGPNRWTGGFNSIHFSFFFFSFFHFLGGRPPYLPVELWKRTTKGGERERARKKKKKERKNNIYISIYTCCGWPRDPPFHPGPFLAGGLLVPSILGCNNTAN